MKYVWSTVKNVNTKETWIKGCPLGAGGILFGEKEGGAFQFQIRNPDGHGPILGLSDFFLFVKKGKIKEKTRS